MTHPEMLETYRGAVHLGTPHPPEAYPGLQVLRPGDWEYAVIVPEDGRAFVALGGEWAPGYRLRSGAIMEGFTLRPGDQVTRVRSELPHGLAEWRIQRAR